MQIKHSSLSEEIANSITHGVGLLLAVVGSAILITRSFSLGTTIFALALVLTYTFSTLYHSLYFTKAETVFRRLDHSSIFLLIAGTYSAFLNNLILLALIWFISTLGILYKSIFINRLKRIQIIVYLLLGWMGIFLFGSLTNSLSPVALIMLILGGIFYTMGVIFYGRSLLKFNHSIWHLFVLAGSFCHYLAIWWRV